MTPIVLEFYLADRTWLTANDRFHWRKKARIVKQWRRYGFLTAVSRRLPRLDKAHILCDLHFTDRRRRDPGNFYPTVKALIDGLVDAGVFDDDDHTRVIGPDLRLGDVVGTGLCGLTMTIIPLEKP